MEKIYLQMISLICREESEFYILGDRRRSLRYYAATFYKT